MVFGFAGAVIAGFLLTAVQTWTGQPSLSGKPLAVLVVLWLLARGSWWQPFPIILLLLNAIFLLAVTAAMTRLLWAARQNRNYPIAAVLLLLTATNALTLCGVCKTTMRGNAKVAWQPCGWY
jgi:uncharacterized protein involved in response to NO